VPKKIELGSFGIVVELDDPHNEYGDVNGCITSDLHEEAEDPEDETIHEYNAMMDAIESMILAHACSGIDIEDFGYIAGIEIAVEACANNC
jgi:hypothetical protein